MRIGLRIGLRNSGHTEKCSSGEEEAKRDTDSAGHAATLADERTGKQQPHSANYNDHADKFPRGVPAVAQRTFSIIKPDAVRKGYTGAILAEIEKAGFQIIAVKKQSISKDEASGFYAVHKQRPFFDSLTTFMSNGPIVLLVLEKDNAVADLRKLMGATNPANAEEGTIRKKFAGSIEENAIHGSDAEETAAFEISYWFAGYELI
jgi:nucleoside-diphosphate kinase